MSFFYQFQAKFIVFLSKFGRKFDCGQIHRWTWKSDQLKSMLLLISDPKCKMRAHGKCFLSLQSLQNNPAAQSRWRQLDEQEIPSDLKDRAGILRTNDERCGATLLRRTMRRGNQNSSILKQRGKTQARNFRKEQGEHLTQTRNRVIYMKVDRTC